MINYDVINDPHHHKNHKMKLYIVASILGFLLLAVIATRLWLDNIIILLNKKNYIKHYKKLNVKYLKSQVIINNFYFLCRSWRKKRRENLFRRPEDERRGYMFHRY